MLPINIQYKKPKKWHIKIDFTKRMSQIIRGILTLVLWGFLFYL